MKKIKSVNFIFDYNKMKIDIEVHKEALGLSYTDIDKLAGIGTGNTSNIMRGTENMKMNTWLAIANALDIDPRDYFVLED